MSDSRPNILLIMTDTSRCDTLTCYSNPQAVSPALDRLAAEGVRYTQAHTAAPVCMPARCSLLTGVHTPVHGCVENGIARRTDLTTLPDVLAAAGYHTIMVGKAHFAPIPDSFAVQRVLGGEKGAKIDDFYAEHLRAYGFERASRFPNSVPPELFCDAFLADTTIAEIDAHRGRDPQRPFFAWCSMPSPHSPLDPPGAWATLFDERGLPEINRVAGEEERHPDHLRGLVGLGGVEGGAPDRAAIDRQRRLYYGLAAYCDAQVGRLLDHLDRNGIAKNTLVIFCTDHGQQYYDHGFNDKHTFYDASWRIPLILRLPGVLPAGVTAGFAMTQDVTATCAAVAGASVASWQGFDLMGDEEVRHCAVAVLHRSLAVVSARWKLEYFPEQESGRLFDRIADPAEQVDRYFDPRYATVTRALREALLAWRAELTDVEYLQTHTHGGGPVARRVAAQTAGRTGLDAERRLDQRIRATEEIFIDG